MLAEVDLHTSGPPSLTGYDDDDSLLSFEQDITVVARAVLASGDEIRRLREALAGVERCKLWMEEDCRAGTAIEALAASGTATPEPGP